MNVLGIILAATLCGNIETVAGGGPVGDGGPAAGARLSLPGGVLFAPDGDLVVVDFGNHRIRRVDAQSGTITTVAGTGEPGFSGDGGPADRARLARPENAAFDPAGNLYVVDSHNHRVRRIDAKSGTIATVAGDGMPRFAGDGGPAARASLYQPEGIAFDGEGNWYIGDTLNNRVRRVDAKSGTITTVAGNGSIGTSPDRTRALDMRFLRIARIAVGPDGNVYLADSPAHTIQKIDLAAGLVRVVAGIGEEGFSGDGGPAAAARLSYPEGLTFDAAGNLYFGDLGRHRIRRVDAKSGVITTIAGTGIKGFEGDDGPASKARLWNPGRIAVDAQGNVFVADISNARIRRIGRDGMITTVVGSGHLGDGGRARAASLAIPGDLAFRDGRLYIAEFGNRRIRRVDVGRGTIATIAGGGSDGLLGPAAASEITLPESVAVAPNGDVYIADSLGHVIWHVDALSNAMRAHAGTGTPGYGEDGARAHRSALRMPGSLALAPDGRLFVSDFGNRRIRAIARNGEITTVAVRDDSGLELAPQAVSLAFHGDSLYWIESGDATLYRLGADGKRHVIPVRLPSRVDDPTGFQLADLAVAPPYVYLAETLAHRVLRLDLRSGAVDVIAGTGTHGFAGDAGPATQASLFRPGTLAIGDAGELYIGDTFNHRVRVVHAGTCESRPLAREIVGYRMPNGFGLVVAVQPELELAAVNLHVAGGALSDPPNRRGMAHVLEHASLTGTLDLGSHDRARELRAIESADAAYRAWRAAEDERQDGVELLRARFGEAEAGAYAAHEPGEIYGRRIESQGGVGMNAVTTLEATQYLCRLPTERLADWLAHETARIRTPLFRDFYRERDVVLQEIRSGGGIVAGDARHVETITRAEALNHFRVMHSPERMALAVVGNVDPETVRKLVAETFGTLSRIPTQPAPSMPVDPSLARYAPRGSGTSAALDAVAALLSQPALTRSVPGRGQRVDSYLVLRGVEAVRRAGEDDLAAAILHARRQFRNEVSDPGTLAALLAFEEATRGDWRAVERHAWHLERLTPSDVSAAAAGELP